MALAPGVLLAPHFSAGELGADSPTASEVVVGNLRTVAAYLEQVRAVLGVPLRVTSGYRSLAENQAVGGVPTSSHLVGLAADFVPVGLTQYQAYTLLSNARLAGTLPPYDQLVYYPGDGHLHVGLRQPMRGDTFVSLTEGSYQHLTSELAAKLPGAPAALAVLFLVIFAAIYFVQKAA